ncbi:MAG TPA: gliding motility-associated C-terminal domain-containing protein, partial [Bacteroidetes bacterium]|nr:gliding motility-associated C-terminal domain-containing protein [Bacteroidota bacterium]
ILSNSVGCDSIINISLTEKITSSNVTSEEANCFGYGKFIINSLENVQFPVQLIIQNHGTYQVDNIPFTIDDLPAGNYTFDLTDHDGCIINNNSTFNIQEFVPFNIQINVSENQDNYVLDIDTDMNPETIQWTPASGLSCSDCISTVAKPDKDTEYIVVLTDAEGCTISDTVFLKAKITEIIDIDIPNIFTPDGDGYNEIFYAKSTKEGLLYDMYIYDRWGENIYSALGLTINEATGGWDGIFKNKKALPGVYVYMIIVDYGNGKKETFSGDVLLIR